MLYKKKYKLNLNLNWKFWRSIQSIESIERSMEYSGYNGVFNNKIRIFILYTTLEHALRKWRIKK